VAGDLRDVPGADRECRVAAVRRVWSFGDVGFFGNDGEEIARITCAGYPMLYRPQRLAELDSGELAEILLAEDRLFNPASCG
jgi:hypothetical protein